MKTRRIVSLVGVLAPSCLAILLQGCSSDNASGSGGSAGSSGSTGTGGSGTGTGGSGAGVGGSSAGVGGMVGGIAITQLIDDFENGGDARIVPIEGKQDGYWFTYNENAPPDNGTCAQIPPGMTDFKAAGVVMGGANGSTYAGKTSGMGCSVWGAGMGVDPNHPGAVGDAAAPPLALYDASAFTCLVFTAKSMNGSQVLVQLGTPSTISSNEAGGACVGAANMCDNNYGAQITLTPEFKQHSVPFGKMVQGDYGFAHMGMGAPGLTTELSKIVTLHFQFNKDVAPIFDMTIDDVGLVASGCPAEPQ